MKKDFLTITDFSAKDLSDMLALAEDIKKNPSNYREALEGKTLGMIFNKNSTRTRISFEVGIFQLGGYGIFIGPKDMQLTRGETVADTAQTLSRYLDGIMIRTFAHKDVEELAKYSTISVINGLTDYNHPCQAFSDIMTIKEKFGQTYGLKLAYVGDGNNMARSLLFACVKFGMDISIASPKGYALTQEDLGSIQDEVQNSNLKTVLTNNVEEAVTGADIVYTDVWASMGQEEEHQQRVEAFNAYSVDDQIMAWANKDAVFMHCLPAHRGEEVSASVIDGKASIVFNQAENRLHAQKAIMVSLLK